MVCHILLYHLRIYTYRSKFSKKDLFVYGDLHQCIALRLQGTIFIYISKQSENYIHISDICKWAHDSVVYYFIMHCTAPELQVLSDNALCNGTGMLFLHMHAVF